MAPQEIISYLPYQYPFLFVEEIVSVDENAITGTFTYDRHLPFYKGHFKNNPITPGVILTETMAQIGLVAYGIYLMAGMKGNFDGIHIALTSTQIEFYKSVLPDEKVIVKGVKEYFRFNKLKCNVEMYNQEDELVCKGTVAGMMKVDQ